MMNYIKISVIIPIYNCEKFIKRCLDSLNAQTIEEIEFILVCDDGTKDQSNLIARNYAKENPRFIIVEMKHGGLSDARNAGIKVARGEYIGFVDSDDYIATDMFEALYKVTSQSNAELAICNYALQYKERISTPVLYLPDPLITDTIKLFTDYIACGYTAWNKLFKKSLLEENSVSFIMDPCEDYPFCLALLPSIRCTVTVDRVLYFYVQRPGSLMHSSRKHSMNQTAIDAFLKYVPENPAYDGLLGDYAFLRAVAAMLFSPGCVGRELNFFKTEIKKMRKWSGFRSFCRTIVLSKRLKRLCQTGAIGYKFYWICKVFFFLTLLGIDFPAAWLLREMASYVAKKQSKIFP